MDKRAYEMADWQNNLSMAFKGPSGIVGERVLEFTRAEQLHKEQAVPFWVSNGFTVLFDAFQDFALQTVDEAQTHRQRANVFSFALVSTALRRLRAALNVFYDGYYYDSASHLRSVFESVLYLGAVAHGYIRYDALIESANRIDCAQASQAEVIKTDRQVRTQIDTIINDTMRGKGSGLSTDDQYQLQCIFFVLHAHVHKASSSVLEFINEMWSERKVPSTAPAFDETKAGMFCTTAVCVAWAFTRVLPCVSLPSRFSQDWHYRMSVLEDSFGSYLEQWDTPVGRTFVRFMETKMKFTDESFRKFEVHPEELERL